MKEYKYAVFSWIIAFVAFYIAAAIAIRIIFPFVLIRVFGVGFPPKDEFGRALYWGLTGTTFFIYYLMVIKTPAGKKFISWFKKVNEGIIFNRKP